MGEKIDFDSLLKAEKIELQTDTEKVLELCNWRIEERDFDRDNGKERVKMLVFDVLSEDGQKPTVPEFSTSSKRLIAKLKPVIESALKANKTTVKLGIIKTGESFNTQYVVRRVE